MTDLFELVCGLGEVAAEDIDLGGIGGHELGQPLVPAGDGQLFLGIVHMFFKLIAVSLQPLQ